MEIFVAETNQFGMMGTLLTDDAEIAERIRKALTDAGFTVRVQND